MFQTVLTSLAKNSKNEIHFQLKKLTDKLYQTILKNVRAILNDDEFVPVAMRFDMSYATDAMFIDKYAVEINQKGQKGKVRFYCNEVENMDPTSGAAGKATDLYAIRRRTETKEIEMDSNELWGYVANVVLNGKICEKFMPKINAGYKNQILDWCFKNWDNVTERNLSLIEKMTKDIVRYPSDYLDIWNSNYLQVVSTKKGKK